MTDPRHTARNLIEQQAVSLDRLWVWYWAEGGNAPTFEFDAFLHEALLLHPFDLKILTWALEDLDPSAR
ncbi:hypothetical protein [Arthrobacter sp. ISL-95]|uniref:hypothetical protein n=1 Tax=Arthrobacter sp. ISL-95 TaxID=2819116 RepID=UPI001BE75038|nr:hypothetical protein [Arthrobacter sp. ISL-95]MBT2588372.1 hypothetical protein [Arthrobacter sp. ISL-95]